MTKKWNADDYGSPSEDAASRAELEAEARRRGLEPWQLAASRAVPDKLVADLVSDAYRSNPVTGGKSMAEKPKPRGSGWVEPSKLETPYVAVCDRLMDAQDARDRAERIAELQARIKALRGES
jgi:hypothetical protein